MENTYAKYLKSFETVILNFFVILFPIFVWFGFTDSGGFSKLILLIVLIFFLFFLKALEVILQQKVEIIKVTKLDLFVFLLGVAYFISGIMKGVNKWESFFLPGTASLVICLVLLYFFLKFINTKYLKTSLIVSSVILSLSVLLLSAGFLDKTPGIPAALHSQAFNLTGNFLGSALLLLVALPFCFEQIIESKELARKVFFGLSGFIIAFGLILSIYKSTAKDTALTLPDFGTSWQIALDTVKVSPLFGAGPGNYLGAFEKLRPVSYNYTPFFDVKFTNARNGVLTLITETGLFGLICFSFIIYWIALEFFAIVKLIGKGWIKDEKLLKRIILFTPLFLTTLYLFFFPGFIVPLFLFFVLLSLNSQSHKNVADFSNFGVFKYFFALMLIIPPLFIGYKLINPVKAELNFKSSYDNLAAGDAKKTYESLIKTIELNPNIDRYHATFAQINLAIAKSMIQKTKNPKDEERKQIALLVQTAINEAKLTVSTNANRSNNWVLLAQIYQAVIPLAQKADQFAIASYNQAIILDPIDPTLRINLGGLHYGIGQYDKAIDAYRMAVALKNDYANAHYNLALAYKKKGEKDLAKEEFTNTLSLLKKDSADYKLVQKELDNVNSKETTPTTPTEAINAPIETTPELKPRIDLPQEATPPATLTP